MPVWPIASVEDEPSTTLVRWSVWTTWPGEERHLVGWAVEDREGRVSSAVRAFDVRTLRATTRSGRVYELRGRPGNDLDAKYVWNQWKRLNDVERCSDVTKDVWAEHKLPKGRQDS
jgi:hypothetical protein